VWSAALGFVAGVESAGAGNAAVPNAGTTEQVPSEVLCLKHGIQERVPSRVIACWRLACTATFTLGGGLGLHLSL
jgi:hypothetical protein